MEPERSKPCVFLHTLKAQILPSKMHIVLFIWIISGISVSASDDLKWCLTQPTFYYQVKMCPTVGRNQALYHIKTPSKLSLRVKDEDFKLDGDILYLNGTLKPNTIVPVTLVNISEAEERIGCMLLKFDVDEKNCICVRNCTIVISVLASLCLILFMAFSIVLIVIHRRMPLTCDLRQKKPIEEDTSSNGTYTEQNSNDQGFISPRKASYAPNECSNGSAISPNFKPPERFMIPRKSSLKISRIEVVPVKDDPLKNGSQGVATLPIMSEARSERATDNKSFENEGYQESESSRRNSATNESPQGSEGLPNYRIESRRKSTVTFSDKTEIIRIMSRS